MSLPNKQLNYINLIEISMNFELRPRVVWDRFYAAKMQFVSMSQSADTFSKPPHFGEYY
jgi:hypothetical protein